LSLPAYFHSYARFFFLIQIILGLVAKHRRGKIYEEERFLLDCPVIHGQFTPLQDFSLLRVYATTSEKRFAVTSRGSD
jgi:hypothetical protein